MLRCNRSDLNTSTEMREVPGVLKESLGSFPAPLDVMIVSYLANLASALVFQKLLIAAPSFPWQYGKFGLCILITWPRLQQCLKKSFESVGQMLSSDIIM